MKASGCVAAGAMVVALLAGCGGDGDSSTSESTGKPITKAQTFAPFKPSDEAGTKPDLPKVLAFVQDSPRGFQQQMASGLKEGAEDAGLEFDVASSNGDPEKEVQLMQQVLAKGVGALVVLPVNPPAQEPVMREALDKGVDVGVIAPATSEVNAPQYQGGEVLGKLAATHIKETLGGKANVVILNQDSVIPVRPRFEAIRAALKSVPGAKIVADVEPELTDTEHGFQTMSTILQKVGQVDVVLGADAVVLGALAAMKAAHKTSPDQFLGGVDCEEAALAEIEKGGSYKVCIATSPAVFGYAWAQFAGDWLEGKTIPTQICALPVPVTTPAEVARYKQDQQDPAAVFDDPQRLSRYVHLYGDISYDTRGKYLAFQWGPKVC